MKKKVLTRFKPLFLLSFERTFIYGKTEIHFASNSHSGGTANADDAVSSENVLILDTICRQGKDQTHDRTVSTFIHF